MASAVEIPQISVVIPTRNSSLDMAQLIESLDRQILPPSEIIIIDSSDEIGTQNFFENNNLNEMLRMKKIFKDLNLDFIPSTANFITLIFNNESEAFSFSNRFLKDGIILRHLKSFGLPECVRVTLGNKNEMDCFIEKLEFILEKIQ